MEEILRTERNANLSDVHEAGPRLRKATMIFAADKYNPVYERAVVSHIRHGERWNEPTHILRHDIVEAGFFNKPAYILGMIINEMAKPYGKRADWIVWFDADSILLNHGVPWSVFLPPPEFRHIHFLVTKDQNGFNAGMFIIRVHQWSVKMLSNVLTLRDWEPSMELPFDDQSAFTWAVGRPGFEEHTIYQPHNWWNSFGLQGKPSDTDRFVLHFAGVGCCGGEDKPTTMLRWLDLLSTEPDHFYTPLSNLSLQAEVDEYWSTAITAQNALVDAQQWLDDLGEEAEEAVTAITELRQTLLTEADDLSKLKASINNLVDLKLHMNRKGEEEKSEPE